MGQRILYLIRHGQYELEPGPTEAAPSRLTSLGRKQARRAARRLGALPISVIHHSTLQRAAETAQIIASKFPGIPLRPSRLLCECIPCIPAVAPEIVAAEFSQIPPDELERDAQQAEKAFDKYFKPTRGADRQEIVVCHGNIIRYFVCRALQVPPDAWLNMDINNCGITEVLVKSDGQLKLLSHNDTGHLPYDMRTFF